LQIDPNAAPDIARLAAFFESDAAGDGMTLPEVDGFLTAVAIGPRLIPPSEWLSEILRETPAFDTLETAREIYGALMQRYNQILRSLDDGLAGGDDIDNPPIYAPIFYHDSDGAPIAAHWCAGFMAGVALREDAWTPLARSRESAFMLPIFAHHPATKDDPEAFEELSGLADTEGARMIPGAVVCIHRFWRRRRAKPARGARETVVRSPPKVGRNQPCPCGSGLKYKHCCLRASEAA